MNLLFVASAILAIFKFFNPPQFCFALHQNFFANSSGEHWTPIVYEQDGTRHDVAVGDQQICLPVTRNGTSTFRIEARADGNTLDWADAGGLDCSEIGCSATLDGDDISKTLWIPETDQGYEIRELRMNVWAFSILNMFR